MLSIQFFLSSLKLLLNVDEKYCLYSLRAPATGPCLSLYITVQINKFIFNCVLRIFPDIYIMYIYYYTDIYVCIIQIWLNKSQMYCYSGNVFSFVSRLPKRGRSQPASAAAALYLWTAPQTPSVVVEQTVSKEVNQVTNNLTVHIFISQ